MVCLSLSIVIITKNEESNLARTLQSVTWADEIVIVDSGSTDRTCEIAESFHTKFFGRRMERIRRPEEFRTAESPGDWVLSLDADEEVEPALADEIQQTLRPILCLRLLDPAQELLPRPLDSPWRLLSRSQATPLSPRCRQIRRSPRTRRHQDKRSNGEAEESSSASRLSHARKLPGAHESLLPIR